MPCTTILVGKKASYDGSTMISRNDDSSGGHYTAKKFIVVQPSMQPKVYESVLSHVKIELPENPMRYTAAPNAIKGLGIWAASGVNEENIAMTATETISNNERVLGADPLVKAQETEDGTQVAGGIGEEDFVVLTLAYIHSAREGVLRVGKLLKEYGTYEMNGMAFQDENEIWWLETIGGHHWIARRVPDEACAVIPNQLGLDRFDLTDAFSEQKEYMCSEDLKEFICENHLAEPVEGIFNPREAFGTHADADHVYNTPRAWDAQRYLRPDSVKWEGPNADYQPESDTIPWSFVPDRKINVEDIKYVQSSHFQGTSYDPYSKGGDVDLKNKYRPIGINRTDFMSLIQIRPYMPAENKCIKWIAFGCNVFNCLIPFYSQVNTTPAYMAEVGNLPSTENYYWASRILGSMADADYMACSMIIERYQHAVMAKGHELLKEYDSRIKAAKKEEAVRCMEQANREMADFVKKENLKALDQVLFERSNTMKNAYIRHDG